MKKNNCFHFVLLLLYAVLCYGFDEQFSSQTNIDVLHTNEHTHSVLYWGYWRSLMQTFLLCSVSQTKRDIPVGLVIVSATFYCCLDPVHSSASLPFACSFSLFISALFLYLCRLSTHSIFPSAFQNISKHSLYPRFFVVSAITFLPLDRFSLCLIIS